MRERVGDKLAEATQAINDYQSAALLGEDGAGITPEDCERQVTRLRAEVDHWAAECRDVKTWLFDEFPSFTYEGEAALLVVQYAVSHLRAERDDARAERNARARDVMHLEGAMRAAVGLLETYMHENRGAAAPNAVYRAYRTLHDVLRKGATL